MSESKKFLDKHRRSWRKKLPCGEFLPVICLALLSLFTVNANATVYVAELNDPASVTEYYELSNPGASVDYILASYDDSSDLFTFRYEFTSPVDASVPAGQRIPIVDAWFKMSNDGIAPDASDVPWYLLDGDSGKFEIVNSGGHRFFGDLDYSFNAATGKGHFELQHDVSDVWAVFDGHLTVSNWSGGSFESEFGIWNRAYDGALYQWDPVAEMMTFGGGGSQQALVYDTAAHAISVSAVPLPAPIVLMISSLASLFMFVARPSNRKIPLC